MSREGPSNGNAPGTKGRLTPREWRWLALVSLAVALLADLPFLVSTLAPPEGLVAVYPSVVAAEDYPQYLGAMHDAVDSGTWYSIDHFSTETHRPVVLRPFYTALGLMARSSGLAPEALYRAAVLLGRVMLCAAIYLFVAVFFGTARNRWLGFAMVLAVSGLLGLLDLASGALPQAWVQTFEQRLERPEYGTFLLLFHHPHLTIALALILLLARSAVLSAAFPAGPGRTLARGVWMAFLVLAISTANPFSSITLAAALAGFALLVVVGDRRRLAGAVRRLLPVVGGVVLGLLAAAYLFLLDAAAVFRDDPFWKATYGTPRGQETPPPEVIVFHLFFLLVLAAIGAPRFFSRAGPERAGTEPTATGRILVTSWLATTLLLMVIPSGFPVRFAFGLQPMLAVVATAGALSLHERYRGSEWRSALLALLAVAMLTTPMAYARIIIVSTAGKALDHLRFRSHDEVAAAAWLRESTGTGDAILASYPSGNFLGGRIRGRVFIGHDSGTLDIDRKKAEVQRFFSEPTTADDKIAFLRDRDIDYVYFGPFERSGAAQVTRDTLARLEPVREGRDVVIYRVSDAGRR